MIPLIEPSVSLQAATKHLEQSAAVLCSLVSHPWQDLTLSEHSAADLRFDGLMLCWIEDGNAVVRGQNKRLLVLEPGDLFVAGDFLQGGSDLQLSWDGPLRLRVLYDKDWQLMCSTDPRLPAAYNQWQQRTRLFLLSLLAQHVTPTPSPHTGFRRFHQGETIINEGEAAEFVYTLLEGRAEVFAADVKVGDIGTDEIFGAMAALAGTPRSATVKAATDCQVMMVARDEFYLLVNSHPQLFINLLRDMARVIVSLNEKVVSLKGR